MEPPRPARLAILALVFASGAAGLAYEISWSRQLGLAFGQTARAAAIVLAAYFLGMALGYTLAGRLSARVRYPLIGFAVAEGVVGLWAGAVPKALALATLEGAGGPLRVLLAIVVLLPGTTALGASLPFVAQAVGASARGPATQRITQVYAANLAGALLGVVVSTALLAPVGVVATSWGAAGLSIAVGLVAYALRGRFERPPRTDVPPTGPRPSGHRLWVLVAAGSGFGALGAQVLYMRLFSLVFHNSTYTFAAILVVVLFSLSLASTLGAWAIRRGDAGTLVAAACALAGASLPLSVFLLVQLRGLDYFAVGGSFLAYLSAATGLVAAVVFVPVLAMGLLLPLAWHLAGADERPGPVVGQLTTANTVGAALGALAATFALLPALDLWWSFVAVGALYLGLGGLVLSRVASGRRRVGLGLGLATLVAFAAGLGAARFEGVRPGEALTKRFAGPYGWIDVTHETDGGGLFLRQNVHYGLGSRRSSAMELRQGHLPLFLHPAPKRVAFIGMATGITASAALDVPEVERVTVMELIPEVVEAARLFADDNAGLLDDPRVEVVVDDGRHALRRGSGRFDVVVADLFVPWESKTGYLYTVEHYAAVRARLTEDGLFCQWLAGWQIGPREFEVIAESLQAVFPHVSIWQVGKRDRRPLFALVGAMKPRTIDLERLDARLAQRRAPAREDAVLRRASDVAERYLGDWQTATDAPLNTDEHPIVEFSAPLTHRTKGQRLRRRGYRRYRDERLSTLPREAFRFEAAPPPAP